jgi:hypothetical protein
MIPTELLRDVVAAANPVQDRAMETDGFQCSSSSMDSLPQNNRFWPRRLEHVFDCWNWKCALMSATARSLLYLAAMARENGRASAAIFLVEIGYVTLTAGLYAGLQQRALGLRSRLAGNLTIVIGVPALSQGLDWLAHRAVGASAPAKANLAVCIFATLTAFFHLYVMRRGAFLTGGDGGSLKNDFRRMPILVAGFVLSILAFLSMSGREIVKVDPQLGV